MKETYQLPVTQASGNAHKFSRETERPGDQFVDHWFKCEIDQAKSQKRGSRHRQAKIVVFIWRFLVQEMLSLGLFDEFSAENGKVMIIAGSGSVKKIYAYFSCEIFRVFSLGLTSKKCYILNYFKRLEWKLRVIIARKNHL